MPPIAATMPTYIHIVNVLIISDSMAFWENTHKNRFLWVRAAHRASSIYFSIETQSRWVSFFDSISTAAYWIAWSNFSSWLFFFLELISNSELLRRDRASIKNPKITIWMKVMGGHSRFTSTHDKIFTWIKTIKSRKFEFGCMNIEYMRALNGNECQRWQTHRDQNGSVLALVSGRSFRKCRNRKKELTWKRAHMDRLKSVYW